VLSVVVKGLVKVAGCEGFLSGHSMMETKSVETPLTIRVAMDVIAL
jgi:hypothetical protein